jgi:hypothetical protein
VGRKETCLLIALQRLAKASPIINLVQAYRFLNQALRPPHQKDQDPSVTDTNSEQDHFFHHQICHGMTSVESLV